ncbi:MAG: hypothetical protein QM780_09130 [Hyphomicrobium sp.]|uniref:hypothetical protein n=1 Tax=Hyphomicrobium sp. TaxID=82 RepID=UPI0039E551F2
MEGNFDRADVPTVAASDLGFVLQLLIDQGQGLALLRGMNENEIREIENRIWAEFQGSRETRLAVALRFRALLDVFTCRRLKALFLDRGFRTLAAAASVAATRPLNVRFGFNPQRLLMALETMTAPALTSTWEEAALPLAA